jgi:hypothetical protein
MKLMEQKSRIHVLGEVLNRFVRREESEQNAAALEHMKKMLDVDTRLFEDLKKIQANRHSPARRSEK